MVGPRCQADVVGQPLFTVRSYMSAPRTFRTSPGSYAALCGVLSVPLVLWVWAALARSRFDFTALAVSLALPAVAGIWLGWFRLQIDDSGLEYRDLFGRNFKASFSEIAFLKSRVISFGRGSGYEWMLHLHDGRRLRLNLKPFPREVYGLLCQRIRCHS